MGVVLKSEEGWEGGRGGGAVLPFVWITQAVIL